MKTASPPTIENLFNAGSFSDVIDNLESSLINQQIKNAHHWPLYIGSLIFLGQTEKAFSLYHQQVEQKQLSASLKIACRFYLIIGAVRTSQYNLAQSLIIENLREKTSPSKHIDVFYKTQGLAFYRFFCGRFLLSKKYALRAFASSIKSHFLFGEMISTDLLGHSLVHLGSVREGLKHLETALALAKKHKNQWLMGAIEITIAKFRAQHGIEPAKDLAYLEKALESQSPTDTYSRAELLLELNRQYVLRGFYSQAESFISQASDIVYKHQNRRQMATINLRMSYMLYLQKNYTQALHIIRFAEQNIQEKVDRGLFLQMQGLKASILKASGKLEEYESTLIDLKKETLKSQNAINQRILQRKSKDIDVTQTHGEDPLGDLIDATERQKPHALNDILTHRYYGLFHKYFKLPFHSKAILVDLVPGSIVLINAGNVIYKDKGLNSLLRKILLLCRKEPQSKESLVANIWGYTYDPSRHDPLIYSATNKLRKLLHPYKAWFQLTENGYCIRPDVRVLFKNSIRAPQSLVTNTNVSITKPQQQWNDVTREHLQKLNFRQIQVIRYLKSNPTISIGELSSTMSISKPTATRDLSQLVQLDIVHRIGQGRATRYFLKLTSKENL